MTDLVRYGIIGTGMMGIEHIQNLNALDGAAVTAIADPYQPSREAALATADGGAGRIKVFENHHDLLADDGCDAYVIVTPNTTHAEMTADVMTTGKPILLEKPMCTTVAQCQDLVAAAADYPSPIWVGLEYRYMAPVQRLIGELATGAIGTARMIAIREHRFPFLVKVGDWNRLSANTGGTLVEKCCHYFDLMNLIAGSRPHRVYASGGQDVNHLDEVYDGRPSDILDNAFVIVDYENGLRASLDLCMFAEASRNQEEISVVGDRGKVEALIPDDVVRIGIRGRHSFGNVEEHPVTSDAAHAGLHHGSSYIEHQRFLDVIRNGGTPEVTVEDGLWSVAVGVAGHRSIDEVRPVTLDEVLTP
ncbi:MAG: Gfo/Idh/MocA family oxidoreductase [Acidimicrobiia bacterium]|nr:Gfo/Idh/MocA family oxidoreductase [Acidimicrobiia bacterium]